MQGKEVKTGFNVFLGKLAALIDVKSIITITLVAVLCILTLKQMPIPKLFDSMVTLVIGFFFGKNISNTETRNKEDI